MVVGKPMIIPSPTLHWPKINTSLARNTALWGIILDIKDELRAGKVGSVYFDKKSWASPSKSESLHPA